MPVQATATRALADHEIKVWPRSEWGIRAITFRGACEAELTIFCEMLRAAVIPARDALAHFQSRLQKPLSLLFLRRKTSQKPSQLEQTCP